MKDKIIENIVESLQNIEVLIEENIKQINDQNFLLYLSKLSDDCGLILTETKILTKAKDIELNINDNFPKFEQAFCPDFDEPKQFAIDLFLLINISNAKLLVSISQEKNKDKQILEQTEKVKSFYEKNIDAIKLYLCN